jgi:hypothetical protein
MSFFAQRYPLRWAAWLRRQADAKKACSCQAQRNNALASQLECMPGSLRRARVSDKETRKKNEKNDEKKKNLFFNLRFVD